ncbi:MAG: molybdopterin molybdotransferase MoeA [Phycisphaerales bacterium]
MGFRGEKFAFDSPALAVSAMIARLSESCPTPTSEQVPLCLARGRVLARPVRLDRDSPAFDHSAMDGYALRLADFPGDRSPPPPRAPGPDSAPPLRLAVAGESRIGTEPPPWPTNSTSPVAVRIVTGAAIPAGADCVVKREDVAEHGGGDGAVASITIAWGVLAKLHGGDNIRRRAENARAGEVVLEAGSVMSAAGVGVLAAVGAVEVEVARRVRVSVITTGDELVEPGQSPSAYQIRNSNAPTLRAILSSPPWLEVMSVVHARDDGPGLDDALCAARSSADAIVLTGGVSMGHRDPVRAAVERLGARIIFHGLPQRPGKPMLGAIVPCEGSNGRGGIPIFALPGNPISAMVTCTRIALPVLASMAGAAVPPPAILARMVTIGNHDGKAIDLWWHRLAALEADGSVRLLPALGSGDIVAGGRSDGFVELAPGSRPDARTPVPFYSWL